MNVFYTSKAIGDLERLRRFIAEDSKKAAHEIHESICQAVERLKSFPSLGKKVKTRKSIFSLRDIITGNYIIRYALLEREIHILRIWHSREDRCSII